MGLGFYSTTDEWDERGWKDDGLGIEDGVGGLGVVVGNGRIVGLGPLVLYTGVSTASRDSSFRRNDKGGRARWFERLQRSVLPYGMLCSLLRTLFLIGFTR